jgi:hypothetical protein
MTIRERVQGNRRVDLPSVSVRPVENGGRGGDRVRSRIRLACARFLRPRRRGTGRKRDSGVVIVSRPESPDHRSGAIFPRLSVTTETRRDGYRFVSDVIYRCQPRYPA